MNIGLISSLSKPTTLETVGGTELFCALMAENLAKKGHKVYLFASAGSHIPEKLVEIVPVCQNSMMDIKKQFLEKFGRDITPEEKTKLSDSLEARLLVTIKQFEDKVDVFHDNTSSPLTGSVSDLFSKPFVTTMHLPPQGYTGYYELPPFITKPTNNYVAISSWEKQMTSTNHQIYNGIDISNFSFYENSKDHLIWIGRISASNPKGFKEALTVIHKLQKKLVYQGSISDKSYYDKEIKPLLFGDVLNIPIFESKKHKNAFFGEGKAFIFPALWEEPFPFVVLEAYASGTPIIAYAKGSLTETVIDGETGFLVNSSDTDIRGNWITKKTGIEGLMEAVNKLYSMPDAEYKKMRLNARKHVEKIFTAERMADQYLDLYKKITSL